MFKRKIYQKLLDWKINSNGTSALLIQGARRVGKSTIAEEFARNEYRSYILIDFSNSSKEINDLFDDISDLNYFFLRLQFLTGVSLYKRESLIIFDEVQLHPPARQAIKHLVADRRYDYIETGSLISIRKNVKDILIPSEEDTIDMYPMDYEEFKWAIGDNSTIDLLRSVYESLTPLGDSVNRKLMRDFRLYMLVGGMPQAVQTYLDKNNLRDVDQTKRRILHLYENDFRKIDSTGRASMIFDAIPAELRKNAKRYQVSSVLPNERQEQLQQLIADMQDSKTVLPAYLCHDPSAGMSMTKDLNYYKLFACDTGLFVTLAFKDKDFTENDLYNRLLSDKLHANLGYLYENIVAQTLKSNGNELFYYTFPSETSNHNYEIDFLMAGHNKVSPVEVKSSGYKTHISLDKFSEKFSDKIDKKYLLYSKDIRKDKDVICLPVYMAMFL